ncbi:MAG: DMT family transporter [Gammaproteobacteria bacterium WSBS_2016_MAG_OTU1]
MHLWQTIASFGGRCYANPYLLLVLATLFFGGNTVAGRLAVGHISPYQLVSLRWIVVAVLLSFVLGRRRVVYAWQQTRHRIWWMFGMATLGFTSFNTLFYLAAHNTSAVNLGIIQGTVPMWVLLGAFALYKLRVGALQLIGVLLTVVGVILLATKGDLTTLAVLTKINIGDLMMLLACFCYACYTLGLKKRPQIHGLEFFYILTIAAMLGSLPLAISEIWRGETPLPSLQGILVLCYVAFFPSCLSQIFFIRGVEILGPSRAGVFLNLVPVFSALCAVLLIDESLLWFQITALVLVLGGIWLSENAGRRGEIKKMPFQ